jgi:hypothetical protein
MVGTQAGRASYACSYYRRAGSHLVGDIIRVRMEKK